MNPALSAIVAAAISIPAVGANTTMHLPFEGTTTSEQGHSPAHEQNVSYTGGVIGQGLQLGNESGLDFNTDGILDPIAGAISFWVRPGYDQSDIYPGYDNNQYYLFDAFDRYDNTRTFSRIVLRMDNNNPNNIFRGGVNPHSDSGPEETQIETPLTWNRGELHHIVFNYDLNDRVALFYDGKLLVESSEHLPNTLAELPPSISIGYYKDTHAHHFPGMIDEFKIWDNPLSLDEIAREMNVPEPSTIGLLFPVAGLLIKRKSK